MNYELSKSLKEAGFPHQEGWEDSDYYPTLEELIEACGDELDSMYRGSDGSWLAEQPLTEYPNGERERKEGEGSTPSEAVANLWLALHTPKTE